MAKAAILTVDVTLAERVKRIVLVGPTASGKSSVALALAKALNGEILSVDSMQVYRGMDIGTAKPTQDERAAVRHHAIDLAEPTEPFAVSRFVEFADAVIADAATRDCWLIVTGGTPLYYKALFEGLFDGPGADAAVRQRLEAESADVLHARLQEVDPAAADRIHVNDHRRLARALEVFELTGKPISSFQTAWSVGTLRYAAHWFGLQWEKEALNRRINARVRQMIDAGWLDEARRLRSQFETVSQTAAEATGYAELIEHLDGRISLPDAIEAIKIATRQLARRQMKWFRRWPQVQWLPGDGQCLAERILQTVNAV